MILECSLRTATIGVAALLASPLQADVLQIDATGSRWVSGPAAATQVAEPIEELAPTGEEGLAVDERIIVDPHWQARVVPAAYSATVRDLARRFDLSPALIEALVWQESRWRANAVSHKGARGLGQLMPGTARELGVDPNNPHANLEGAARYLRAQLDRFDGDIEKALAAYNAGPGRVERANGVPRIAETRKYVSAIMGRLSDHSRE